MAGLCLSKPTHKGQTFIQLDPLGFLDRIVAFIPKPYRHRRHYHGVFAPNSPLRKKVVAYAKRRIGETIPACITKAVEKVKKAAFEWAELIARIYEVDPLICSKCGKKVKILGFVTHKEEIQRILSGIGWPFRNHDFDPPYELPNWDVCQLIPETTDGFPVMEVQVHYAIGPDPPSQENYSDPPHWEDNIDPPHWSD